MQPAVRTLIEQALADARKDPPSAEYTRRLAMLLDAHKENAAAEAVYARANALDPAHDDTLYNWGRLLAARGDHKGAVEKFRGIKTKGPAVQYALMNALRESGEAKESERLAREWITQNPSDPTAHYLLGRATGEAAPLAKAIELFPRYGAARFALATLYRRQGQPEAAAKLLIDYERDKLVTPPYPDPAVEALADLTISAPGLLRRALREESAGRLAEAAALQRQALSMEPNLPDAWANLISLEARLGHDQAVEEAYRNAGSANAAAHYNYGVYCLQKQRPADAANALKRTLEIVPNHADAAMNLAGLASEQGNIAEAIGYLRKAISARPTFAQAHFQLGRILAAKGQYPQAVNEFTLAVRTPESDAGLANYLYGLGVALARSGNRSQAVEVLRQAKEKAAATGQSALHSTISRDIAALDR